jgi:curved DNA-binding protein CbpA
MSNAYFFKTLDLPTTATEAAVRKRYKLLALVHHPDKAEPGQEEEASIRFCDIQHAYEYCMSHLDPNAYEEEGESSWDGELPAGIFNANSAWWNELKGNEPTAIKEWAVACENAIRFSSVKLDDLEQYMLNIRYQTAYNNFESWRRRNIEEPQEEQQLQDSINALPERLRHHARRALDAKRARLDYDTDNYQEDHDEELYFDDWEIAKFQTAVAGASAPKGTWRDFHNSTVVGSKSTPQKQLALFRKQIPALEQRVPTFGIEDRTRGDKKRRKAKRDITELRLVQAVKLDEKIKRENELRKRADEYMRSLKNIGPSGEATAATLKK